MFENFVNGKKNAFGLDIGYKSLKVAELRKSGKNFSLVGYREISIPENSIQKNSINNKSEIIQAIKEAMNSAKPHRIVSKNVCAALPASLVFTKMLKLPPMKNEELEKAIPYEVADFFPIPVGEMNLDWHIINNTTDSVSKKEIDVLVICAPKTLASDYMEITSKSGLELIALETKPISAARAILTDDKKNTALVDIGAEITSISFVDNDLIEMTTIVPTGGNAITRDLAKSLNISPTEAENMKKTQKVEFEKDDDKNTLVIKNINLIAQEIKESVKYFETRIKRDARINQILLCGGGSQLYHLDKFLEKELKIPTKIANPWERIRLRPSEAPSPKDALKYTTAIGLAMREL